MVKKYGIKLQIARRHLVWFTGLTCDELSAANQSAFKVQNRQTKEKKKKRSPFYDSAPSARVIMHTRGQMKIYACTWSFSKYLKLLPIPRG